MKQSGGRRSLSSYSTLPGNLIDLGAASLFLNLLSLAVPVSLLQVYDRILPNQSEGTLLLLIVGTTVALVLEGVLRTCRSWVTGWIAARFEHMAGCGALERLLTTNLCEFERDGAGVHLERLGALNTVKDFYAGQAILTFLDLPFVVIYLVLVALLGHWLVVVPVAILALFGGSALLVGHRLRGAVGQRMQADDRRFSFIIEVLSGVHSVKAMAMESAMQRRYERLQEGCADADHGVALQSALAMNVSSFYSQLTVILVAAAGSLIVVNGDMTTGGLAACSLLAGRSLQPIQRALGIWTRFQTIRVARDRLAELFTFEPEAHQGLIDAPAILGALALDNVRFRYREDLPEVIQGVSLSVAAGECVAIAGDNASGKSTLLALAMGALRPTGGRVQIDGHDLDLFDPQALKRQIAYLPQQGVLFQGTLIENITMFDPTMVERALHVASTLGLDDVVAGMPYGYDTRVGDGAADQMPRGIKQRIAVARALVHEPRVVLFDEANTAVDGSGDNYIKTSLVHLKGRCTLILVTHRPSLLKLASRVYDLRDGRLELRAPGGP